MRIHWGLGRRTSISFVILATPLYSMLIHQVFAGRRRGATAGVPIGNGIRIVNAIQDPMIFYGDTVGAAARIGAHAVSEPGQLPGHQKPRDWTALIRRAANTTVAYSTPSSGVSEVSFVTDCSVHGGPHALGPWLCVPAFPRVCPLHLLLAVWIIGGRSQVLEGPAEKPRADSTQGHSVAHERANVKGLCAGGSFFITCGTPVARDQRFPRGHVLLLRERVRVDCSGYMHQPSSRKYAP